MNVMFGYFVAIIGFLFLLAVILMFLVWEFAHRAGRNEERAELMPSVRLLEADNTRMKQLLDARPYRAIEAVQPLQKALGPGMEYTATHKWKTAPEAAGKDGE